MAYGHILVGGMEKNQNDQIYFTLRIIYFELPVIFKSPINWYAAIRGFR